MAFYLKAYFDGGGEVLIAEMTSGADPFVQFTVPKPPDWEEHKDDYRIVMSPSGEFKWGVSGGFGFFFYTYKLDETKVVKWFQRGVCRTVVFLTIWRPNEEFFNGQPCLFRVITGDGPLHVNFDSIGPDAVSATLDGKPYRSGAEHLIVYPQEMKVVLTAHESTEPGDFKSTQTWELLNWKRTDNPNYSSNSAQLTIDGYADDYAYVAYWKPTASKITVKTGTFNGYTVSTSGEPGENGAFINRQSGSLWSLHVTDTVNRDTSVLKITLHKETTTYNVDTGVLTTQYTSQNYDYGDAITIPRETDASQSNFVVDVVYRITVSDTRDKIVATLSNTYLLKGAGHSVSPAISQYIEDKGGVWNISYNQPENTTYTVGHRATGDFSTLSGEQEDTLSGKTWRASFALYAIPIDPEDPEYPEEPEEDPEDPEDPGAVGGDGGGLPSLTSPVLSLVIDSTDSDISGGVAEVLNGETPILTASYPDTPTGTKPVTKGVVYILNVHSLPANAEVSEVSINQSVLPPSRDNTWIIPPATDNTVRVIFVTLSTRTLPILTVDIDSYPVPDGEENAIIIAPTPPVQYDSNMFGVEPGTNLTFTPDPLSGYTNYGWRAVDVIGKDEYVEAYNLPYRHTMLASTAVVGYFKKMLLSIDFEVVGWPDCDKFACTVEDYSVNDDVPAVFDSEVAYIGDQIGIYKKNGDRLITPKDVEWGQLWVDMPVSRVEYSMDGGETWQDAGGDYVTAYNAQSQVGSGIAEGRPAARIGKITVDSLPTDLTVRIRVYLNATVSVSVGMPPVTDWGSMVGSAQNNWGGGYGKATITAEDESSASMEYYATMSGTPPGSGGVAGTDYFEHYPYINVELGSVVVATATPLNNDWYFASFQQGYFKHDWEDSSKLKPDHDFIQWPGYLNISTDAEASVRIDCGMYKVMALFSETPKERYVIFTIDKTRVMINGSEYSPYVAPVSDWILTPTNAYYRDGGILRPDIEPALGNSFNNSPMGKPSGSDQSVTVSQILATFGLTENDLNDENARLASSVDTICVNRRDIGGTTTYPVFKLNAVWMYLQAGSDIYIGDHPAYLGLFKRTHSIVNGLRTASPWEFVGKGVRTVNENASPPSATNCHKFELNGQVFFENIEYRVRFLPKDATPEPQPWEATVGYKTEGDMVEGDVFWEAFRGVQLAYNGPINVQRVGVPISADESLIIKATPKPGFIFVAWHDADGVVISTAAEYYVNKDTDGDTFLAVFQPDILPPVGDVTFYAGYVGNNHDHGAVKVKVTHNGIVTVNTTVVSGVEEFTVPSTALVVVTAVPDPGYHVHAWVNQENVFLGSELNYYPLMEPQRLYGVVEFAETTEPDPNEPEKEDFTVRFLSLHDAPYATALIRVNGSHVGSLSGVLSLTVGVAVGDTLYITMVTTSGYRVGMFLSQSDSILQQGGNHYGTIIEDGGNRVIKISLEKDTEPIEPELPVSPNLLTNPGLWLLEASDQNKEMMWRSRRYEFPTPVAFNCAKLWRDGVSSATAPMLGMLQYESPEQTSPTADFMLAMESGRVRRTPSTRREHYHEVVVVSRDPIDRVAFGTSMEALK